MQAKRNNSSTTMWQCSSLFALVTQLFLSILVWTSAALHHWLVTAPSRGVLQLFLSCYSKVVILAKPYRAETIQCIGICVDNCSSHFLRKNASHLLKCTQCRRRKETWRCLSKRKKPSGDKDMYTHVVNILAAINMSHLGLLHSMRHLNTNAIVCKYWYKYGQYHN